MTKEVNNEVKQNWVAVSVIYIAVVLLLEYVCIFKPWLIVRMFPPWAVLSLWIYVFFYCIWIGMSIAAGVIVWRTLKSSMGVSLVVLIAIVTLAINTPFLKDDILKSLPLKEYPTITTELQKTITSGSLFKHAQHATIDIVRRIDTGSGWSTSNAGTYFVTIGNQKFKKHYKVDLEIYASVVFKRGTIYYVYAYIPVKTQKMYSLKEYTQALKSIIKSAISDYHGDAVDRKQMEQNIESYNH